MPVRRNFSPRWEKARNFLESRQLPGCLVASSGNISWLVGQPHTEGLLLLTKKEIFLFVPPLQQQADLDQGSLPVNLITREKEFVRQVNSCRRVGFISSEITVERYERWKKQFSCLLKPLNDFLLNCRAVKDSEERQLLKKAREIARKVMRDVITKHLKPGVEEREIAEHIRWLAWYHGGEGISFPPIVASGYHTVYPHHRPGRKKIQAGEPVIVDLGVEYQGYHSDLTETVFLERPNHQLRKIYSLVRQVQRKCLKIAKPGIRAKKVHQLAVSLFRQKKMEGYFVHGLGHGVGLAVHEKPVLNGKSEDILQPGMVITIEPGLYLPGIGGVRLETMLIL
ncbi:MAG: aminopeptidase P family protein [Candidatus Omnitrophica bacterium]|nr:aminopeptidase P family protein [Candidatus Omnitrophota bacterium]